MTVSKHGLIICRTHSNSHSVPKCRLLYSPWHILRTIQHSFTNPLFYFYLFILNIWSKYISKFDWCESFAIFYVARDGEFGFESHLICILLTKRAFFLLLVFGMHSDALKMCSDAISNFLCATKPNILTPAKESAINMWKRKSWLCLSVCLSVYVCLSVWMANLDQQVFYSHKRSYFFGELMVPVLMCLPYYKEI